MDIALSQVSEQFQHTAARRRLVVQAATRVTNNLFQHTAARRRLVQQRLRVVIRFTCFNTQPPEGGWDGDGCIYRNGDNVSTHSRPKAAGLLNGLLVATDVCFNTQPPEGGWKTTNISKFKKMVFQHTAARRRLG